MSWVFSKLASKFGELRSSTSTLPSPGPGLEHLDVSDDESDYGSEDSLTSTDTSPSSDARSAADAVLRGLDVGTEEPMHPADVLSLLQEGNDRFVKGTSLAVRRNDVVRREIVDLSQSPHAAIVGCSDCQAPLESIFDSLPGDIFAFKNAGNTCIHANGSMVASLEFCTEELGCRFILVLGHRHCGVLLDACKSHAAKQKSGCGDCALNGLQHDLSSVIDQAAELASSVSLISGDRRSADDIVKLSERAVEVNVFQTLELLLRFSETIRQNVRSGQVELQAAIFDEASGKVEFLGTHPMQEELLESSTPVPPWPTEKGKASCCMPLPKNCEVPAPKEAIETLRLGNARYVAGVSENTQAKPGRTAIANPFCSVLACADVRVPVDTVFDMKPGDIFVMRNAGNTCTHAAGSIMSSLEFSAMKFGVRLILILGHTQCASITGAVRACMAGQAQSGRLSRSLGKVAQEAADQLGEGVGLARLSLCAVKLNVLQTMEIVLRHSRPIRELAQSGRVQVQGAVYHMESGCVEFLGPLPNETEVLVDA